MRVEELSARELERKISDMKRDRVRVEDTIRRMESNQQRIFREEGSSRVSAAQEEEEEVKAESPSKDKRRRRSRSGSRSDSESKKSDKEENGDKEGKSGKEKDGEAEEKDGEAGETKEGERKRKVQDKEDSRPKRNDPRSRNLFGKLLGHLHSAKTRLDSEKGSKAAELNAKAQEKIEEKLSLSKMNIKEFRKAQFGNRKKEEEAKVVEIDKSIEEMECLLLQKRLEGHYSLMMNFIRTKAEPTIFYLPAKHTKDTEHSLEETRAAIKHKVASLKVQLRADETQASEDSLRATAAAAAVAAVEAPEEEGKAEGAADDADADAKADEKSTPPEDKPESDKKQAPSDDEDDQEEKDAADGKAADSDASSAKKRKASGDDGKGQSKKRKEDGGASDSDQ